MTLTELELFETFVEHPFGSPEGNEALADLITLADAQRALVEEER